MAAQLAFLLVSCILVNLFKEAGSKIQSFQAGGLFLPLPNISSQQPDRSARSDYLLWSKLHYELLIMTKLLHLQLIYELCSGLPSTKSYHLPEKAESIMFLIHKFVNMFPLLVNNVFIASDLYALFNFYVNKAALNFNYTLIKLHMLYKAMRPTENAYYIILKLFI